MSGGALPLRFRSVTDSAGGGRGAGRLGMGAGLEAGGGRPVEPAPLALLRPPWTDDEGPESGRGAPVAAANLLWGWVGTATPFRGALGDRVPQG